MPQQINLCSAALRQPRQPFSANTMALAWGIFLVLGGVLCSVWVWKLQSASREFETALQAQTGEVQSLQAAIDRSKALAQGPAPALVQEVQDLRAVLARKEGILGALQQGQALPGYGHSDRLALLARSIPTSIWITEVKADQARMEVSGYTLEPSALNEWVARLSASPLMQGLRLATVKVQSTALPVSGAALAGTAPLAAGRDAWSFNLVSAQASPPDAASAGVRP